MYKYFTYYIMYLCIKSVNKYMLKKKLPNHSLYLVLNLITSTDTKYENV